MTVYVLLLKALYTIINVKFFSFYSRKDFLKTFQGIYIYIYVCVRAYVYTYTDAYVYIMTFMLLFFAF